jgi:hypothetical protein
MADAPLPLNAPTELIGEWFEPDRPDNPASGRLRFDPVDGLTFETVSDAPMMRTEQIPIMLGVTVDGRWVTLRNVTAGSWNYNPRGGTLATSRVGVAFVGMHATTLDELRLWNVDARLSHLNDWCFRSGIEFEKAIFPRGGCASRPLSRRCHVNSGSRSRRASLRRSETLGTSARTEMRGTVVARPPVRGCTRSPNSLSSSLTSRFSASSGSIRVRFCSSSTGTTG